MIRMIPAFVATLALSLAGCKQPVDDHDHAEGDGHAHEEEGHSHEGEHAHVDEVVLTSEAIAQYGVKVEAAQLWNLRPTFIAPARIAFNSEAIAHVGSPLSGRVAELKARLGDRVQAGDALVIVESPDLGTAQSDFLVKRSAAETAAPAVDLAKAAWDRAKSLNENPDGAAMTLTEVQKREAEHRVAVAALKAAQVEAQAAENNLHLLGMSQDQIDALLATGEVTPRFTIIAPIAGQVVQREVTLGELVSPDRDALLVLGDLTTLWVLADVPDARVPEVALGATAWINAGSLDAHRHEGQVSYIAPSIDPRTRSASVRVVVTCEDGSLKPGMFVQVEIASAKASSGEPVVAVPEEAIQVVEGGPAVFVPVAGEDNTFAKRAVVIGKTVGGLIPIHSGLVEGEQFVIAGSFILKAELGKSTAEHVH